MSEQPSVPGASTSAGASADALASADAGQRDPLLATKLYVPRARANLVSHPRLLDRLGEGLASRLILVSGPAGFGKSTLVSEWIHALASSAAPRTGPRPAPEGHEEDAGAKAAWLSLDADDSDLVRFLSYLSAALQTIEPGIGAMVPGMLREPLPPTAEHVLTMVLDELCALPGSGDPDRPCILVLDDYHSITAPAVHSAVGFMVDHAPPQMHMVIITRADPPLPLARLRSRGHLVEIRADDLRFASAEATLFLNQTMGLSTSLDQVATLRARTEGWIAGLQLAALAMRALLSSQDQRAVHAFVTDFSGSNRYIVDYLAEEVLRSQPPEIQSFLLQTSILNRLNGALCDVLTGRTDSQALLAHLDQSNLFVVPMDDQRYWYRYHHLFADFLRTRVPGAQGVDPASGHSRAATWYEQHGFADEAMFHALAGRDFGTAVRVIEREGGPMLNNGDWSRLLRWLGALPEDLVLSRAALCLLRAWALTLLGQLEAVEPSLQAAEQLLAADTASESSVLRGWRSQAAAIRGRIASAQGDIPQAIALSHQALALSPEGDLVIRGIISMNLGLNYLLMGDLAEARRSLEQAHSWSLAGGNLVTAQRAAGVLAQVYQEQGRLHQAASEYHKLIHEAQGQANHTTVHAHHITWAGYYTNWMSWPRPGSTVRRGSAWPDRLTCRVASLLAWPNWQRCVRRRATLQKRRH